MSTYGGVQREEKHPILMRRLSLFSLVESESTHSKA